MKKKKAFTLRSFVTYVICGIVMVVTIVVGILFYRKSASLLYGQATKNINEQLNQINVQVAEKIDLVDSIYPLLMSNTLISEHIDPAADAFTSTSVNERKSIIEKQMSQYLFNTYLADANYINSVTILESSTAYYNVMLNNSSSHPLTDVQTIFSMITDTTKLQIFTLDTTSSSVFFVRNIYSTYNGKRIGSIIIDINQEAFLPYEDSTASNGWLIYLFDKSFALSNHVPDDITTALQQKDLSAYPESSIKRISLDNTAYLLEKTRMNHNQITLVVAAKESELFQELNNTLKAYVIVIIIVLFLTIIVTAFISQLITAPIENMIAYVKRISMGNKDHTLPISMYEEFNEFADAFEKMLHKLDEYYRDSYEKQILLKNAELQALKSQMDPHFLFNILDTIAWKAQLSQQEEIYQMIISLGELLRKNTLSKETDFVSLKDELEYVRFYVYLQQTRFEDKISATIQMDPKLENVQIPCFSIQPLVENAVVHGIEPMKGSGKIAINIIRTDTYIEIAVSDNGIGFTTIPDLNQIQSSGSDSHTHIGLKNLNKRLCLLYDQEQMLHISSVPGKYTIVSFRIPV